MTGALERADTAVGDLLERALRAHHRRRLKRIGWLAALDAPAGGWADGDPPPRPANELEVLVDGAEALPRIAAAVEGARSHVWIAGWFFSPELELGTHGPRLRELLAEAAERVEVRILGWAGAPLPLFHPDRGEVRAMREALVRGTRIRLALDDRERPMHCHHEKLVIVDGETAFVGGIDLTTFSGNRFDTSDHPSRGGIGWHDATSRVHGPAVADVADHFRLRWNEVTGERLPESDMPADAGELDVQVVRTVPERIYHALARGDFRILESYLRALRSAERLVYLENQFLWSPEIVAVLAEKLRNPPADGFRVVVVLPAKPKNGAEDTRGQLGVLMTADDGGGRLLACTIRQRGVGSDAVYVHAKTGLVDDRWLTIGSANLNEHSLFNDTEMNIVARDERLARATRLRLWAEHLECDPDELDGDPTVIVDRRWRPLAEEQLRRREDGLPPTHRLVLLPNVSRRAAGMLGPINGFLVDG
ncbi:MAG TPA: phospholipase D family protein [Gaiellaceae bacterium]|nr:phospholipase D family protein [Gaiellaceae bacterium]